MTMYRLPDDLGGHFCDLIREHTDGKVDVVPEPWAQDGTELRLPRYRLVEVKPPSIDDPVELPLDFEDIDGDRFHLEAIPAVDAAKRGHVAFLTSDSYLTRERCRDAARALWRLGTGEQP